MPDNWASVDRQASADELRQEIEAFLAEDKDRTEIPAALRAMLLDAADTLGRYATATG